MKAIRGLIPTVALLAVGVSGWGQAAAPSPAGRGGGLNFPVVPVSPEISADNHVTFRLSAPNASTVVLNGNWPGGTNIPMTKGSDGVWSVTTGPIPPELWPYTFGVDGVSVLDPGNTQIGRSIAGPAPGIIRRYSVLLIVGPNSLDYRFDEKIHHGTMNLVWYPAPTLQQPDRRAYVYTPPGYETSTARYPVLYLLHGGDNDEASWSGADLRAPIIIDNLIAHGKAKPMIVVMPNHNPTEIASRDIVPMVAPPFPGMLSAGFLPSADSMVKDLIPFIDKAYRTKSDRDDRAVAGFSFGAAQAMYLTFNHIDLFAWLGSFSCGCTALPGASITIPTPPGVSSMGGASTTSSLDPAKFAADVPQLDQANAKLRYFYLSIGTNDFLVPAHNVIKDVLNSKGVKYHLLEAPGYSHEGRIWRINLDEFAQKIFQ